MVLLTTSCSSYLTLYGSALVSVHGTEYLRTSLLQCAHHRCTHMHRVLPTRLLVAYLKPYVRYVVQQLSALSPLPVPM